MRDQFLRQRKIVTVDLDWRLLNPELRVNWGAHFRFTASSLDKLLASLGGNKSLIILTWKRLTWKRNDLHRVGKSAVERVS